jgi:hypothetical protein
MMARNSEGCGYGTEQSDRLAGNEPEVGPRRFTEEIRWINRCVPNSGKMIVVFLIGHICDSNNLPIPGHFLLKGFQALDILLWWKSIFFIAVAGVKNL